MTVQLDTLVQIYEAAFQTFAERDFQLLDSNAHEQSWSHRIAMYMEMMARRMELDPRYQVDCEYNRNGNGVKRIRTGARTPSITCDIILHSRGQIEEQDNLIAIEIKKSVRPLGAKNAYRDRIVALTRGMEGVEMYEWKGSYLPLYVCGYGFGVYLEFNVNEMMLLEERYVSGALTKRRTYPLSP